MSIIAKISEWKRDEDKRHDGLSAIAAIASLGRDAREDLITYLTALNEAKAAGDEQEQEYLLKAILEVFEVNGDEDVADIDQWAEETGSSPTGREAAKELEAETERFFRTYQRFKARSKLTTVRKVAEAAGISPTTVQAIEKQRVKPQFKTVQALAKAFGVDPTELNEGKSQTRSVAR